MMEENRESKLPKNIKQIGQAEEGQKIYIEDYVMTYLKQMLEKEKQMRVSVLYGRKEMIEDELYWFVNGAIEAETDFFMHKTVLDEESWQKVNELAKRFFDGMSVLGWAVARPESTDSLQEQIIRTQKTFFRLDQKIYFEYITDENKEDIYLFEKGKFRKQEGYYVYYDKNECMQNYMVSLRAIERHPEEFEADRAMKQIRENREEKRQLRSKKRTATFLTCFSMILVTTIMIIGVTMLNNYEKMESMEKVLTQISGKIEQTNAMQATQNKEQNVKVTQESVESVVADPLASNDLYNQQIEESNLGDKQTTSENMILEAGYDTVQNQDTTSDDLSETMSSDEKEASDIQVEAVIPTDEEVTEVADDNPVKNSENHMPEVTSEIDNNTIEKIDHSSQMVYIIQQGDTLATICLHYYGNLARIDEICSINHIENKDNIYYGQKIYLP